MIAIVNLLIRGLLDCLKGRLEAEVTLLHHQVNILRCACSKLRIVEKSEIVERSHTVLDMVRFPSSIISIIAFRFRRRASLEVELMGLRHASRNTMAMVGQAEATFMLYPNSRQFRSEPSNSSRSPPICSP
jgi:hypothetical protein